MVKKVLRHVELFPTYHMLNALIQNTYINPIIFITNNHLFNLAENLELAPEPKWITHPEVGRYFQEYCGMDLLNRSSICLSIYLSFPASFLALFLA